MESCILDKSVSMLKSTSNYPIRGRNTFSPAPGDHARGFRNTQFERVPSDNELPDFDKKATDFTQNVKSMQQQRNYRDMRYSQRNYGYQNHGRNHVDFVQRMARDPNENAFSSSNSNLVDNLKFIQKRGENQRQRKANDMGLPVKRKGTRGRSKTPKKLAKMKQGSEEESEREILKDSGEGTQTIILKTQDPKIGRKLKNMNSASSPKLQTKFFPKKDAAQPGPTPKQKIEDILDPSKKKKEDLKKFELKMETNEKNLDELIIKTIPDNSKKEIKAKAFFKDQIVGKEGLKFETPAFGKKTPGVFEFDVDVGELKTEDIFFKNKIKSANESVSFTFSEIVDLSC